MLGQKIKGEVGRRGRARDADIAKRKKTLLVEMKNKNKTNEFFDKRFGEYDENVTAEEKMLMRFQHERAKSHQRGAMFQLDDGEDELTHHGQALGDLKGYDRLSEDEDDDEDLSSAANVGRLNFGGFESKPISFDDEVEPDPEKKKTHKEIMMEVVAKSKMHKMERQEVKRKNDEMTEDVDNDLDSIRGLLIEASNAAEAADRLKPRPKQDVYDKTVRELLYEAKGKATDRLKSPQEVAQAEYERLQKLEAARLARMRGEDLDEDGEDGEAGGARKRRLKDSAEYVGASYAPKAAANADSGRMVLKHNDADGTSKVVMQREDGTIIGDEEKGKEASDDDDSDSDDDSDDDSDSDDDDGDGDDDDDGDDNDEEEEEEEVKTSAKASAAVSESRKRRCVQSPHCSMDSLYI